MISKRTRLLILLQGAVALSHLVSACVCCGDTADLGTPGCPPSAESPALDPAHAGWLRRKLVAPADLRGYGVRFESGRPPRPGVTRLVLLLHGFNSTPDRTAALLDAARGAGLECGGFAYPNDQPLGPSALMLSAELKRLSVLRPGLRVALVTHSMGGLVARACLEDPQLDPGNVDRLVMVAPPTHGTQLARVAVATDLWEHWLGRRDGYPWTRWHDSVVDGLGEASTDLSPGSEFLRTLNARPRNPAVHYTLVLGNRATLRDEQAEWIVRSFRTATLAGADSNVAAGLAADELDAPVSCLELADLDELVDGRGDGVVSVERGRLEGVEDIVVLPFGHLSVSAEGDEAAVNDVRRLILQRVRGT